VTLTIGGTSKSYTLTHDANGNLTTKQNTADPQDKTTYTWDSNNRLIGINQPGLNASFTYDAYGRRIQSSITQGGETRTVQYLYEGLQAMGEIRDQKLSRRLLTGLSQDETIARMAVDQTGNKDAAASRLFMTDALNSVIAQLNDEDSATVANSYAYSPYGESQTIGPDATSNPIRYTSRENDGTELYFYRARYYDPVLKRFISSDPIGLHGGRNFYAYVEGNPISSVDPLGLATYMCTQPLHALGAAGRAVYSPSSNPLYHQFIGIIRPDGSVITGGQDRAGGPWGPGKPSEGDGVPGAGAECKKVEDDNECLEQCLMDKFAAPRPKYSLALQGLTGGQNCQGWSVTTLQQCQTNCKGKR